MIITIDKKSKTLVFKPENEVEDFVAQNMAEYRYGVNESFWKDMGTLPDTPLSWTDFFYYTNGKRAISAIEGGAFSFEQTHRWEEVWLYVGITNEADMTKYPLATDTEVMVMLYVTSFYAHKNRVTQQIENRNEVEFGNWVLSVMRKDKIDKLLAI